MLSFAHILLLILGLVACPMRCMGPVAQAGGAPGAGGCSCCEAPTEPLEATEHGDSLPPAPGDDCGCGSCLCRGAVLSDDDRSAAGDANAPPALDPLTHAQPTRVSSSLRHRRDAFGQPPHACGRDVRILHQSFLI